ncbi:MAG: hypothetical protein O3C43_20895, partial [Verrucomicrobia bacterium]|nr:hypothetical protein [Verrucomicrobiota bacterium]
MGTKLPSTKRVFSLKSILLLFLGLLGLVGLLVLSLPLWLGLAIRTFAPEDLAQFDSYKMEGYGHFRLEGVSVTLPQANVFIDELHGLTPLNWYSKSRKDSQEDFLQIKHLEVILFPNDATEDNSPESSSLPKNLPDALKLLEGLLQLTDTWLPQATIEHATITQDTRILELSDLRWKNRSLNFQGKLNGFPQHPFKTLVTLPSEGPSLEFVVPNADFEIKTSLVENNRDWVISAIILFRENTALLESTFGPSTWLPESATWNLENWELDLQSLGVDSPYPQLSFNLLGGWKEGVIDNSLDGHLSPPTQTSDSLVPPVDFKSQIGGDAESLTVSRFSLEAPGISASMTDPVEYRLKEMQMAGELNFDIDLDLGMLNREELQGQLTGFLNVTTSEGKPSGEFTLQGKAVKIKTHEFEDLNIQAELAWPNLRIEAITARLTSGTTLDLSGLIDLVARQVTQASLSGQIMQKTVAEYLPEDLLLDNISFNTSASGPYNAINHDGSLTIDTIEMDALNPFSTNLTWKGQMMNLEQVEIAASAEAAEIKLDGSGTLSSEQMQWQINALQLATNGQPLAQLTDSTTVTIVPGKPTAVSFDSMKLSGPGGNVTAAGMVAYPNKAQLSIEVDTLET